MRCERIVYLVVPLHTSDAFEPHFEYALVSPDQHEYPPPAKVAELNGTIRFLGKFTQLVADIRNKLNLLIGGVGADFAQANITIKTTAKYDF